MTDPSNSLPIQRRVANEGDVPFSCTRPVLGATGMPEVERAKLFSTLVVKRSVLPLLGQGQRRSEDLKGLCKKVVKAFETIPDKTGAMLEFAVEEAAEICVYLLALIRLTDTEAPLVDTVLSTTSGNKKLVATAVGQNPYYASQQAKLQETAIAASTMGPRLRELEVALEKEGVADDLLKEALETLPSWEDALRAGSETSLSGIASLL